MNMKNMSEKQRNDFGEEGTRGQENTEELSHYEKVVFDMQAKLSSDISVDRYLKEQVVVLSCLTILDYSTQPQTQTSLALTAMRLCIMIQNSLQNMQNVQNMQWSWNSGETEQYCQGGGGD